MTPTPTPDPSPSEPRAGFRRTRLVAAAVFAGSFVLAVVFYLLLPDSLRQRTPSDYTGFYKPVARSLLAGRGYVTADGHVSVWYPPGFPLLIAVRFAVADALGISPEFVLLVTRFLMLALSATLLYWIARGFWGDVPAVTTAAVYATYPLALYLTAHPFSANPFIPALLVTFWLAWRGVRDRVSSPLFYFGLGALVGCVTLIRAIAVGLGFALALGFVVAFCGKSWRWRATIGKISLLFLGNALVLLPWQIWASQQDQEARFVLITTSGVPAIIQGLTYAVDDPQSQREPLAVADDIREVMDSVHAQRHDVRSLGDAAGVVLGELRQRPWAVFRLYVAKVFRAWYGTGSHRYELPLALLQFLYAAAIIWGTWRAWQCGGEPRLLAGAAWLVALYFWSVTVLTLSLARYMVPAMAILMLLIPFGIFRYSPAPASRTETPDHDDPVPGGHEPSANGAKP